MLIWQPEKKIYQVLIRIDEFAPKKCANLIKTVKLWDSHNNFQLCTKNAGANSRLCRNKNNINGHEMGCIAA
jgi:hypothetical protein